MYNILSLFLVQPVTTRNSLVVYQEQSGDSWRDSGQPGETATGAVRVSSSTCIFQEGEPTSSYESIH